MDSTTSLWPHDTAPRADNAQVGLGIAPSTAGATTSRSYHEVAGSYRSVRPQDSQETMCNVQPPPLGGRFNHRYPPPATDADTNPGLGQRLRGPYNDALYPAILPSYPVASKVDDESAMPSSPVQTLVDSSPRSQTRHPDSPSSITKGNYKDGGYAPQEGRDVDGVLDMGGPRVLTYNPPATGGTGGGALLATSRPPSQPQNAPVKAPKKDKRFWLIMSTLMVVMFLSAIDLTIISTALPTIARELSGSQISGTWVTSSFLLTVTAFQPLMGGLADVIGRRNSLILSILFFLGGSVICGVAKSMLILVVGRGVQGVGGGGIQAIVEIIISDITTLRERGLYMGAMGLVFAISSLVAPILGGIFSKHDWRWIFWINLPIGGIATIFCVPCLKLKTPPMKLKDQIHRMDIFGNTVLFGSVVAILIAVTEGGIEHPWSDKKIWIPLTVGLAGLVAFFLLEFIPNPVCRDPILPLRLFRHPTAALSFFSTFLHGVTFYGAVYILPVYFQAIKDASPLQSAFDILPATSPSAPAAVVAGLIMALTGKYKVQTIIWWLVMALGFGLTCLFDVDTPKWQWVIFQLISGTGVGAIFALTLPPIQAALPVSEIAHATATFAFSRSFGSVWGIAIATAIFTSSVSPKLEAIPGAAQLGLTGQTALGFATELAKLPDEMRQPVREAFAHSLQTAFIFFVPLCGVGAIASFFLRDIPLPDFNDSEHGIRTSTLPAPRPDATRQSEIDMAAVGQDPVFSSWSQRTHERKQSSSGQQTIHMPTMLSPQVDDGQWGDSVTDPYLTPRPMQSVDSMRTVYGAVDGKPDWSPTSQLSTRAVVGKQRDPRRPTQQQQPQMQRGLQVRQPSDWSSFAEDGSPRL